MDRMPEEMLLRIFTVGCEREIGEIEELEESNFYGQPFPRRRKPFAALVSQVCRWWNGIVSSRRAKHLWVSYVVLKLHGFHEGASIPNVVTKFKEALESSAVEECDIDVYILIENIRSTAAWQVVSEQILHAIAMLVPFTRRLLSVTAMSPVPEVMGLIIFIISVSGATPRMDNISLGGCYPSPTDYHAVPNIYTGTGPNEFPASFRGEGLKRVSLNFFSHFPQNLVLSPYLHEFSLYHARVEWNQIERLLQPLRELQKLHLDLRFIKHLPASTEDNFIPFRLPNLTDLSLHGSLRRLSSFLHFSRPSTVTTLMINLQRFSGDQDNVASWPILFDTLVALTIFSYSMVSIREFLMLIYAPSLKMLVIPCDEELFKIDNDIHSPLLHDHFVVPPRVSLELCRVSHFLPFLSFLNFERAESLFITFLDKNENINDIPNESGHLNVYPPVHVMSNLRFLEVTNRRKPLSVSQFFRVVSLPPGIELKIDWGLLEKTDLQILRQASVFELHSLQLLLEYPPSFDSHILCNFQSLTKLVIILDIFETNFDWLQTLILPSADHDCSDTPLIFPRLEDLECRFFTTLHDSREGYLNLLFYMAQITESRRSREMPLKRAVLVDDGLGKEINF